MLQKSVCVALSFLHLGGVFLTAKPLWKISCSVIRGFDFDVHAHKNIRRMFMSQCEPTTTFVCLFASAKHICQSFARRASLSLLFVSVLTLSFTLAERAGGKINCASVSSQPSFLLTYFSIPNSPALSGSGTAWQRA